MSLHLPSYIRPSPKINGTSNVVYILCDEMQARKNYVVDSYNSNCFITSQLIN